MLSFRGHETLKFTHHCVSFSALNVNRFVLFSVARECHSKALELFHLLPYFYRSLPITLTWLSREAQYVVFSEVLR